MKNSILKLPVKNCCLKCSIVVQLKDDGLCSCNSTKGVKETNDKVDVVLKL